jgi:hypothetical protein
MIILRNILAVIIGFVLGSVVNMSLIIASPRVIPPPAGVDTSTFEGLKAAMQLFELKHFVFPFLAHALGTLVGALVAYLIAGSHRYIFAYVIGALFLAGGISMCFMIPQPLWYDILDVAAAYLPMAWLATLIGRGITGARAPREK